VTLSYALRLVCLSFASFFLLNAAASMLVWLLSDFLIRSAEKTVPRSAARFLLAVRLLPFFFGALFVLALCIPSYLWLEPHATAERVGSLCILFGILGAGLFFISATRAARAVLASVRHVRLCSAAVLQHPASGAPSDLVVVDAKAPLLAMSGVLRPRLLVSQVVLDGLSPDQLGVVLSHELAHRRSRDNFKRFLFLLAPDLLPFLHPLRDLERTWSRFSEWAADDEATAGDPLRAVSLAAALVQVARLGASPELPYLSTSLLADDRDLSLRVERLLCPSSPAAPCRSRRETGLAGSAILIVGGGLALLCLSPLALTSVHELLEFFLR